MLSADERSRSLRFRFAHDQRRYLAAHATLRTLLAGRIGGIAADLRYEVGAAGKPRLGQAHGFSLSYAGDRALIGLSVLPDIGVDLEAVRAIPDRNDLAELHFTPGERCELAAHSEDERDQAFLLGWTRKEACVKALGTGLATAPSSFETGLGEDMRIVHVPLSEAVAQVEVWSVAVGDGLVAACATLLGPRPPNRPCDAEAPSPPSGA